jgi:hypothetical protein
MAKFMLIKIGLMAEITSVCMSSLPWLPEVDATPEPC